MTSTDARKAQNEAVFREANEEIRSVREELSLVQGKTPFFCECEDTQCRALVRLDLDEYEAIRSHPTRFLIARGHTYSSGRAVDEGEDYLVVEKERVAARVARDTDPRRDDG